MTSKVVRTGGESPPAEEDGGGVLIIVVEAGAAVDRAEYFTIEPEKGRVGVTGE
jgi:hypothetical protein